MPDTVNQKISELPAAWTPLDGDVLAGVQSGTTKKFAFSAIKTWLKLWITKSDVGLSNVANVLQYSASNKPSAADVTYDGTISGLSATDAKGAIDELAAEKQDTLTFDASPTASSTNPVTSCGVYTALGGKQEAIDGGTITLSLSWSGSGPYTQTVTVSGATISSNSKVDLQPTPAQLAQLISDGVEVIVIENNAGTLTATAIGATPSTALTVQCTVTEVAA